VDPVTRLVAESAIRELIGRTALIGDIGEPEDYASVYAPEAVWELQAARDEGIAEIIESARLRRAEKTSGPGTDSKHVVTLLDIEFADADHARVRSYFTFYTSTSAKPAVSVVGSYVDAVVQRDGAWKIAKRVSTIG
jgi:hypothetical protein